MPVIIVAQGIKIGGITPPCKFWVRRKTYNPLTRLVQTKITETISFVVPFLYI